LIYTRQIGIRCISLYERRAVVGCVTGKGIIVAPIKKKLLEYLTKACINLLKGAQTPFNTSDNDSEFAEHEYIAKKLKTNFYFAHPYSSWERELNEYTNGLIRQLRSNRPGSIFAKRYRF
jgi:IS30 family transposase